MERLLMKKEVPLSKVNRLVNSGHLILVSSCCNDKTSIITLAWHMPLSHKPPLLGIASAKAHLSTGLIEKSEEFVINVPDERLLDKVIYCGTHSGRDVDKFKEAGLTAGKADRLVRAPRIEECIGHIECYVRDMKDVGDHVFFIGEPIYALAEENLFDDTWKVDRVKLVYHLGGKFFTTSAEEINKE